MSLLILLMACATEKGDFSVQVTDKDSPETGPEDTHGGIDSAATELLPSAGGSALGLEHQPPNIIMVLTDDQRWDTLWAMPLLQARLAEHGQVFTEAFVTTPLCCPSRTSWLSGGFLSSEVGVLTNTSPNGGVYSFTDTDTLPVRLQEAGYTTGLFGRYLANYGDVAPYVPPGWSTFAALAGDRTWYDYDIVTGSSGSTSSEGTWSTQTTYLHDWMQEEGVRFVLEEEEPFFLYITPGAPHQPAMAAEGDVGTYADYLYRDRAYNEADLSDKPSWVVEDGSLTEADAIALDSFVQAQLDSLLAVDRMVEALFDALDERDLSRPTWVFFSSDNGYLWGEHGLEGKGLPYDESVRVPLLMFGPGVASAEDGRLAAANLDVPATIEALAGLDLRSSGLDLRGSDERETMYLEGWPGDDPSWVCSRNAQFSLVEYVTGDQELYDLRTDPYQETNVYATPPADAPLDELNAYLDEHRALTILTDTLPGANPGEPYHEQLESWGGTSPLTWTIDGDAPEGLVLQESTGILTGEPTVRAAHMDVIVTDSSVSPYDGQPQTYATRVNFEDATDSLTLAPRGRATVATRGDSTVRLLLSVDPDFEGRTWASGPMRGGGSWDLSLPDDPALRWARLEIDGVPTGSIRRVVR